MPELSTGQGALLASLVALLGVLAGLIRQHYQDAQKVSEDERADLRKTSEALRSGLMDRIDSLERSESSLEVRLTALRAELDRQTNECKTRIEVLEREKWQLRRALALAGVNLVHMTTEDEDTGGA